MAALPARTGVLGGGRMGAGIAHALLLAGCDVVVAESDATAAEAARARVLAALRTSIDRGSTDRTLERLEGRLMVEIGPGSLSGCALVIEAVPEIAGLKADVLGALDAILPAGAVIATNTSSMSIDELAAVTSRPSRFLGLHFFNPVPASQLVEVVVGAATDPALVDDAREWVAQLGKTAVVVRDAPGFASSRLGIALGLEAVRMVEEGVAEPADIDAAMTLGYKHPVGPLRLTDIVGLDVRLDIADYLATRLGPRFAAPDLLREKVARGELGRKSGRGFYDWAD
ncbi:MAG TPA: 3-hydroxyacyl-CoA dehydrogenase family protein [Mycobacteriales bacterium]